MYISLQKDRIDLNVCLPESSQINMTKLAIAIGLSLLAACSSPTATQNNNNSATIHLIPVEKNVQLEVLDWGGSGRSLVLLAGGGNTAHVFDEFAPKLATEFHVYGITRRGFGASQFSSVDNKDRLAKDILIVLDSMNINNSVLVGHSIAGAELSSISRVVQSRVAALIYLEAGYPYAFSNAKSPDMNDFFNVKGPQQPSPGEKDLESFSSLQTWNTETYGFQLPQSELRQTWDSTAGGRPLRRREFPGFAVFPILLNSSARNDSIPLPSLVIFAIPHKKESWTIKDTSVTVRNEAANYFSKIDSLTVRQANAFEDVPSAEIIRLSGMHYIFLSDQAEVISAMRRFIKRLK